MSLMLSVNLRSQSLSILPFVGLPLSPEALPPFPPFGPPSYVPSCFYSFVSFLFPFPSFQFFFFSFTPISLLILPFHMKGYGAQKSPASFFMIEIGINLI